ncbi:MAG TPA: Clp protease ClpC, partial [Porphyromonadaceae bacterium]|nr:Clp protease ClpC [Porphyromonadaceae bacterium]
MDNNFSQRVRDIMAYSREEAERLQNNYIGPEHLMLAILRDGDGMAIQVLQDFDVDIKHLKNYIDDRFRQIQEPYDETRELVINKSTEKTLKMSILEARLTKSTETDSEHILLALLKEKNTPINDILQQFHLDYSSAFL